jgi:hypothetical protein
MPGNAAPPGSGLGATWAVDVADDALIVLDVTWAVDVADDALIFIALDTSERRRRMRLCALWLIAQPPMATTKMISPYRCTYCAV